MIQVLGLRDRKHRDKTKKTETFFNKGWRFEKVQDVFNPSLLQAMVDKIPEEERFNLYFTVAECFEEPGRKLKAQWAVPFDIDDLDLSEGNEHGTAIRVAQLASEALQIPYEDMGVVFTGNGVQFFVFTDVPIVEETYFDQAREAYGVVAARIQNLLVSKGIQGKVDKSVWSKGRLMRLPGTLNQKPGKPTRMAVLLNAGGRAHNFDVVARSGVGLVKEAEHVPDSVLKNFPRPDTLAILEGCEFLKYNASHPTQVTEPMWYADISIRARLDNGRELVHVASEGHPGYSHYETENKIDQALAASGPRTCRNIESLWDGCPTCAHYNKCKTPLLIRGPNFIQTAEFGFRKKKKNKDGTFSDGGQVEYQDLIKQFQIDHNYKVVEDSDQIIIFDGKKWEFITERRIKAWMTERVRPEPTGSEMREFVEQLKARNTISMDNLYKQRDGFMNFQNCVLNVHTGEVLAHSPEFGFFDVRPYSYDPTAKAPLWDKFLSDIMGEDAELVQALKEYGGYCLSGDECWLQRAALLVGDGANGKSVYMEVLAQVVGPDSYSTVPIQDLDNPTLRHSMVNKLFNYSEETSARALSESSTFKKLVVGGVVSVKKLYVQPFDFANRAKLIMAANNMPYSSDKSEGLMRRLAIIHFDQKFVPGDGKHDYHMKTKLLHELPGICNSLIKAYKELKARGRLAAHAKFEESTEQYRAESDTVYMFITNQVEKVEGGVVKATELYEEYRATAEGMGFRPVNHIAFGRSFTKFSGATSHVKSVNGAKCRVYEGIKLNKGY